METVQAGALIDELVFLEAWEVGLLPLVSGLIRVRQFHRARPEQIAQHRARDALRGRGFPAPSSRPMLGADAVTA